jgi:hypothetical protein
MTLARPRYGVCITQRRTVTPQAGLYHDPLGEKIKHTASTGSREASETFRTSSASEISKRSVSGRQALHLYRPQISRIRALGQDFTPLLSRADSIEQPIWNSHAPQLLGSVGDYG